MTLVPRVQSHILRFRGQSELEITNLVLAYDFLSPFPALLLLIPVSMSSAFAHAISFGSLLDLFLPRASPEWI